MSRSLVVLALRTGIPPDVWERQADGAIETAIHILNELAEQQAPQQSIKFNG